MSCRNSYILIFYLARSPVFHGDFYNSRKQNSFTTLGTNKGEINAPVPSTSVKAGFLALRNLWR